VLPGKFDAAAVPHFYALSMANAAYMIAVKRSSLLIGHLRVPALRGAAHP